VNFLIISFVISRLMAADMATNILKQNLKNSLKTNHCSNHETQESLPSLIHYEVDNQLNTTVFCQYQCEGSQKLENKELQLNFIPSDYNLRPGDGSSSNWDSQLNTNDYTNILWASLASFLKIYANESCLKYSIEKCGELKNILKSQSIKMKSGQWEYDFKVNCEGKNEILSPFDIMAKSDTSINPSPTKLKEKIGFDKITGDVLVNSHQTCKKIITGNLCFGDCVRANSPQAQFIEILQSDTFDYITKDTIKICADNLETKFQQTPLSKDIKIQLCEKFYWESFYQSKVTGHSCQAARGSTDCDQLFN
jgi:hypothetical protein